MPTYEDLLSENAELQRRIAEQELQIAGLKRQIETDRRGSELQRIGNRAVQEAQEESRRLGVPNVFSRNGKVYYELPNGEITDKNPFDEDPPK